MDPASKVSLLALRQALVAIRHSDWQYFETEMLKSLLRVLLQAAEGISDELDDRLGATGR